MSAWSSWWLFFHCISTIGEFSLHSFHSPCENQQDSWRKRLRSMRAPYDCYCCSVAQLCPTLCDPMGCSMPVFPVLLATFATILQHLLKLMSSESVIPPNHLILCYPLLFLPSIFPNIRVFSNESTLRIRWPTYWSFGFSISTPNEYSGLISFRINWFDLLAVQGTLTSPFQHHSSKASVLWCSAFSIFQLSHPSILLEKPQL